MNADLAMKLEETAKLLSQVVNSEDSGLNADLRKRAEDLIAPLDLLADDIWRTRESCTVCGSTALDRDGDCLSCGETREHMDDLRVVCRDCDMTTGEMRRRLEFRRRRVPDYTVNDFWCDHERDSCPRGE